MEHWAKLVKAKPLFRDSLLKQLFAYTVGPSSL